MTTATPKAAPAVEAPFRVRTTGEFMLLDPITRIEFDPGVATKTERSAFVERQLKLGQLEVAK